MPEGVPVELTRIIWTAKKYELGRWNDGIRCLFPSPAHTIYLQLATNRRTIIKQLSTFLRAGDLFTSHYRGNETTSKAKERTYENKHFFLIDPGLTVLKLSHPYRNLVSVKHATVAPCRGSAVCSYTPILYKRRSVLGGYRMGVYGQ